MYLAGVSVRRVEDITEALWGTRVSPSTVSNLNKKIYAKIKIEAWRNRPIEGEQPHHQVVGHDSDPSFDPRQVPPPHAVCSHRNAAQMSDGLSPCGGR